MCHNERCRIPEVCSLKISLIGFQDHISQDVEAFSSLVYPHIESVTAHIANLKNTPIKCTDHFMRQGPVSKPKMLSE